jgi:hypothetical protein
VTQSTLTRAEVLSALVIDGALGMASGTVQGKAPVEGVLLSPEEREKLGVPKDRMVLFYPAEADGVFFEMDGATATVYFRGGECGSALAVFERALKRAYPAAKQIDDTANALSANLRSRGYEIDFGNGKLAAIDIAYPTAGKNGQQFAVRVFAQQRRAI